METYEVLEKALKLIEREEDWTQHGAEEPRPDGRTCRCSFVALDAVHRGHKSAEQALHQAATRRGEFSYIAFNRNRSHAEVVALFQSAIRAEKVKAGVELEIPPAILTQQSVPSGTPQ